MSFIGAFLLGVVAGLRTFTAPAALSWAAYLGWIDVQSTPFSFMASLITAAVFTGVMLVELVGDQLPSTPSRKTPMQFAARLISGAFSGAVAGSASGLLVAGLVAGVIGAVVGTYGGAALRARLAGMFGHDAPAALIEDAVAIAGAFIIVRALI